MKKENKNKTTKNEKIIDIVRWISILPVAYLEIYLCLSLVGVMEKEYSTYYSRVYEMSSGFDMMFNMFFIALTLVVPLVAIFFSTRFLAPKYKNITAIVVTILGVLEIGWIIIFGLLHMAY